MLSILIIIFLTVTFIVILLIGFFEIRLPFIKTPEQLLEQSTGGTRVKTKRIKKFERRRTILNQYHVGFIKIS